MDSEKIASCAKSVIISMNPNSGAKSQKNLVEQLRERLVGMGYQATILTNISDVQSYVEERLARDELRAVVAAGGDGTVSLLANVLPPGTPLAILPLGTENLLAKYLGQVADPQALADLIDSGTTVRLDAGRANGKLFLVMASCGFDADVVTRLHAGRKGHIRHWSYAKPILGAIGEYRYPLIRLWVDDQPQPIESRWAFIFNVPRYAMNLPIVTDADSMDGLLDLCTFRGGNLWRGLFYLSAVLTGQHRAWSETRLHRFQRLRIEAGLTKGVSVERVPYQLDGDPGGVLPLEIEVQPKFLRVVVSKGWIDKNTIV